MTGTPDRAYVERRVAEVKAACDLFGGQGVTAIIEQVRADGYDDLADLLAAEIVATAVTQAGAR